MQPPATLRQEDAQQAFMLLVHSIEEKMRPSVFELARLCPAVPMEVIVTQAIEWAIAEADRRIQGQGWALQSVTVDIYRSWLENAEHTRQKAKPGTKSLSDDEKRELLMQWALYEARGYTQEQFCIAKNVSRSTLTRAIRWVRSR